MIRVLLLICSLVLFVLSFYLVKRPKMVLPFLSPKDEDGNRQFLRQFGLIFGFIGLFGIIALIVDAPFFSLIYILSLLIIISVFSLLFAQRID